MHGLLITALESGGADNPQTRTRTPLALEHALIFQLRNQAFSTSLRTSEVLRELSNGRP